MDISDRIEPYLTDVDPGDESDAEFRLRLAKPLFVKDPGVREVNGKLLYSAAWIDDEGEHHAL